MRVVIIVCVVLIITCGCKNNGNNTSASKKFKSESISSPEKVVKDIVVGMKRKPVRPDFQVIEMFNNSDDILTVVFQYSGGCEEHDFNAHFNGGWLKSLPPQAVIDFEHLNPKKDACRRLVKDTIYFNMKPLRYSTSDKVVVKYPAGKAFQLLYEYTN